jgi:hypothetical protein
LQHRKINLSLLSRMTEVAEDEELVSHIISVEWKPFPLILFPIIYCLRGVRTKAGVTKAPKPPCPTILLLLALSQDPCCYARCQKTAKQGTDYT